MHTLMYTLAYVTIIKVKFSLFTIECQHIFVFKSEELYLALKYNYTISYQGTYN